MGAIQMRGYVLLSAAAYMKELAGEAATKDIIAGFSPELRQTLDTAKQATWCPATELSELYRALAGLAKGDENRARETMIACGKYTAREASNTFLRLLMKLLTPAMFAKKLPDLWARDCTGGRIEVAMGDSRINNRLVDMQGFDHIGPVAVGYVQFALEAMGKVITRTELQGWSLAEPGPATCSFEIAWQA